MPDFYELNTFYEWPLFKTFLRPVFLHNSNLFIQNTFTKVLEFYANIFITLPNKTFSDIAKAVC